MVLDRDGWMMLDRVGWCWIVLDAVAVQQFCCLLSDTVASLDGKRRCWMV